MCEQFVHWSALDIHYRRQVQTAYGHRFAGISRPLRILQANSIVLGGRAGPGHSLHRTGRKALRREVR